MINLLISGACGKMGNAVARCAGEDSDFRILCGIDRSDAPAGFPVYRSFSDVHTKPDVVVDFSNPALLGDILDYCLKNSVPAVLATTGYTDAQTEKIRAAAEKIPIFFSFNMSLGISLLCSLAKTAAAVLGDAFDVEIVEKHHNQKLDAPSGTALMLANAINSQFGDTKHYEYDRHSRRCKREKSEIGIHSVRGGTIVGEHDIIFAGRDEVITLSHSAGSKEMFAAGALKAARFIAGQKPGLYNMNDILSELK